MKKYFIISTFFAFALFFVGSVSAQTVSGSINGSAKKGQTVRGTIVLDIPRGLHVNSYQPKSEYAIPTRITLSASGATANGVTYPPGKMRRFEFSDEPISVYEGRAVFGFKLTVPKGFRGNSITVKASVRYQACTDEVCYSPKTKTINIRANVR